MHPIICKGPELRYSKNTSVEARLGTLIALLPWTKQPTHDEIVIIEAAYREKGSPLTRAEVAQLFNGEIEP